MHATNGVVVVQSDMWVNYVRSLAKYRTFDVKQPPLPPARWARGIGDTGEDTHGLPNSQTYPCSSERYYRDCLATARGQ
uniref:Uncharacterized protein n=1 Tax=Oryza glumipatula TaxID=40148 RepID=A0A0D9Z5F3_9ORYZ